MIKNRRNTNTKSAIKSGFVKTLKEKGMEHLTVRDITKQSHINRSTFYLHYSDKYDLLEKLFSEYTIEVREIFDEPILYDDNYYKVLYQRILKALQYVYADQEFYYALITYGNERLFVEKTRKFMYKVISRSMEGFKDEEDHPLSVPKEYWIERVMGSVLSIVLLWIKNNYTEKPDDVATLICTTRELFSSRKQV